MSSTEIRALEPEGRRASAGALRRRRDALARDVLRTARVDDATLLRDLVDALAAAVEIGSVDGFVHHAEATVAIAEARGTSHARLDAAFTSLRSHLGDASSPLAADCVDAARLALDAAHFAAPLTGDEAPPAFRKERAAYLEAAIAGRWQAALAIVERALADGHELLDVYADLIGAALYEVGRRWARAEISVADQHVASSVSDYVLSRLYTRLPLDAAPREAAVVACAPTEAHHTGAHIVADALELDGWDVRFLGANASTEAVIDAVDESDATLVALSVALLPTAARAAQLIEALRARFAGAAPRIIVGGAFVRAVPGVWTALGADGFATDVRDAAGAARAARA